MEGDIEVGIQENGKDEYFPLVNIMTQFQEVFERYYGSKEHCTCNKCGHVMEPPAKPAEQTWKLGKTEIFL